MVLYDRLAEIAGEYLKKGRPMYMAGRLKTRKWTDKDGVEKYTTEIIAGQMQLLGSHQGRDALRCGRRQSPRPGAEATTGFDHIDDIAHTDYNHLIATEGLRCAGSLRVLAPIQI